MKILGVDPGTIRMGWGLVNYDDGKFGESLCGFIGVPSTWRMSQRLFRIHSELEHLMEEHQPDVVAVETPFVGRNPRTALAIGQALALVMLVAEAWTTRLSYYSPAEVKMAATGYGAAGKAQVAEFVLAVLGLNPTGKPFDATDALAVAVCHANRRDEAAILQRVDRA